MSVQTEIISTHAPAGGATRFDYPDGCVVLISTHAPAGGATDFHREAQASPPSFLLTPLREGRPGSREPGSCGYYFYSRPCGRGDCGNAESNVSYYCNFYSRPCGRGDPRCVRGGWDLFYFYSRPCGRGDGRLCDGPDGAVPISTHAPAGGAT